MKAAKLILMLLLSVLLTFSVISCDKDDESSIQSSSSESSTQSASESQSQSQSESQSSSESSSETQSETQSGTQEQPLPPVEPIEKWESNASADVIQKAEALLESKHTLTYNEDGSFRVLILADLHMDNTDTNADAVQSVKDRIKLLVDREEPNLVIFTGDNIINSYGQSKAERNITAIAEYLEEKQIPWCHVYGNHDHENSLSKELQQDIYESFEYCISKTGDDLSGVGNYVHGVYKADGSLGALIWCLDSGAYATGGGYDYIKDDQIQWYKESSELLQEYNNGELVYGMMAFHIPLIENTDAYNNRDNIELVYEYTGDRNENICSSATDTELLETIFERGDVKAIVTGHDHINDYMYNYKGVKLCSSPNISNLTYTNEAIQGSRVFDLNTETITDIPTYVSYVIERLNPDDFGTLESDVLLEDGNDAINTPVISGWDSSSLSGSVSVGVGEGCGVGGSNAISISRDVTGNFELTFDFDSMGKLGENKYLIVWADFSNVEFRKSCFGLVSSDGTESAYRVDDDDSTNPPLYYLADGSNEWVTLSHGWDGCFGAEQSCTVKGKKGYFAVRVEDLLQGSKSMNESTLVAGFYFYGDIQSSTYSNVAFYLDNIMLVEDYKTAQLPTE